MRQRSLFIENGDPATLNSPNLDYPGQLGKTIDFRGVGYRYVKLDSGATAAASSGITAANQLAFWKDRATKLVTNDLRFSNRNQVAGVFGAAITAGNYCFVKHTGTAIAVKADSGTTFAAGETVFANSGTAADVTSTDAGTAPTYVSIGVARGAASGGNVSVDLAIPDVIDYA